MKSHVQQQMVMKRAPQPITVSLARSLRHIASWLILLSTTITPLWGQTPQPRHLVVGVVNEPLYLPYSEIRNGEYVGFNRELLDLFAQQQGYTLEYRPYPIKRLYVALINHQIDLKYPDNPYWSADYKQGHDIHYSQPVLDYTDGVMVRPDRINHGIDALQRLGVVGGFTPLPYRDRVSRGQTQIIEVFDYEKLLRQTLAGQLDGAYSNVAVSNHYLAQVLKQPAGLVLHPHLPAVRSQRHLSSIQHPQVIDEFSAFLLEQQQQIRQLKQRYGLDQSTPSKPLMTISE